MVQMPTGTGKTYLFTSVINDIINSYKAARKEVNIMVVAHRMELLDQISATLERYKIGHGFIQGSREQQLWHRVQVVSIQSVLSSRNIDNVQRKDVDYIIVDEAHHSLAESYVNLFEMFPNAKKLGVTATPWRMNQETFRSLYDLLVVAPDVKWFIKQGFLSDFEYISIKEDSKLQFLIDECKIADTGDYDIADLMDAFDTRTIRAKLLESYMTYARGKKGIIYAISKRHSRHIAAVYNAHGIKAKAIDCDTDKDKRAEYIELFKRGEIQVLVNVEIFTEGFDVPDIEFIQLARPTRSLALYLQQVGRALRVVEGKDKAIILDNVGMYNFFGLPDAERPWQKYFDGKEDVEAEIRKKRSRSREAKDEEIDDPIEEQNEDMTVVRGAGEEIHVADSDELREYEAVEVQPLEEEEDEDADTLRVEEFDVGTYYVRGNWRAFKAYPLTTGRGGRVEGQGKLYYEYDHDVNGILFDETDLEANRVDVSSDPRLHGMLFMIASQLKIQPALIYDPLQLADMTGFYDEEGYTPFEILKMLSIIYHRSK